MPEIIIEADYAKVRLTKSRIALISLCDVALVSPYKWRYVGNGYAQTHGAGGLTMHQLIMGPPPEGKEIDHENRDKLDCRRENLRFVTHQENILNREYDYFVGVIKRHYKPGFPIHWQAMLNINGKQVALGSFKSIDEALKARKAAEIKYYGREFIRRPLPEKVLI